MFVATNIELGDGLYGGIDIDRYVALYLEAPLRSQARSWLRGLLAPPEHASGRPDFTFRDLISAFAVAELRARGVSFQKVRLAHEKLAAMVGSDRPMAYSGLYTDGVDVFADLDVKDQLTRLTLGDAQEAAREPLELNLRRVRFDEGETFTERAAKGWSPMEGISVDPKVVFGAPCIGSRRLSTEAIAGMVRDGYPRSVVADEYGLSSDEVDQAVRFEDRLASLAAA